MSVNISLRMSGVLAFFAVLVMAGSWAIVTMATASVLPIEDARSGLIVLYLVSIFCVLAVYDTERRD